MDGEQHVGRLSLPVGGPLVVTMLELHVVPAHPRAAMTERRHRHHPAAAAGDRRPQPVDESEVAEMIGRELRLPPGPDPCLGARHDPGVGDQQIDAPTRRQEPFGERGDTVEIAQIELVNLHTLHTRQRLGSRGGRRAGTTTRAPAPTRARSSPTQCPSSRQSPPPAGQSNRCLRAPRRPSSRHRTRNRRGVARKARCHGTGPRTPRRTRPAAPRHTYGAFRSSTARYPGTRHNPPDNTHPTSRLDPGAAVSTTRNNATE